METFRKTGDPRSIATEAASLRWLAAAEGADVVELEEVADTWLSTRLLTEGSPSRRDAAEFGRRLAVTHAAGAPWWGSPPPGLPAADLRFAGFPAPAVDRPTWSGFGEFYAEARLRPYIGWARCLDPDEAALLNRAADVVATGRFDSPQPALCGEVARTHGDLWGGNVVWAARGAEVVGTLIDPCAHGAHAETDLAALGLFGSAHLDATIAGYDEVSALAEGWRGRVDVHQFHMILLHVAKFGGGYVGRALAVARRILR